MAMGYVYFIMADEVKRFKIGKAEVLPTRFKQLDTASPCEIDIWGVIKSENYESIERELHRKFRKQRLKKKNGRKKEWFAISQSEAVEAINHYGGFYTAENKVENVPSKETIVNYIPIWDDFFEIIESAFPVVKHNILFYMVSFSVLAAFLMGLPYLAQPDCVVPKSFTSLMLAYYFFLNALVLSDKKITKAMLITCGYAVKYLIFKNTHDGVSRFVDDNFLVSLLSAIVFIFSPVAFYRFMAYISSLFNRIKISWA